jgi:hypothetical protein
MSACNQLDLGTLGSLPMIPKNLPGHCVGVISFALLVLQLLPIKFTQENLCGIGNSTMKQL